MWWQADLIGPPQASEFKLKVCTNFFQSHASYFAAYRTEETNIVSCGRSLLTFVLSQKRLVPRHL
jgi:hypothetical protein